MITNRFQNKLALPAILFLCFLIVGCSDVMYIPDKIRDLPKDQLSRININTSHRHLLIDHVKITKKIVYIKPGDHELFGELNIVTPEWISLEEEMKLRGYTFNNNDYVYEKGNDRIKPSGVTQFGYYKNNLTFECKAGVTYNITDLVH